MTDLVFETARCLVRNWRPSDAPRAFDIYRRWEVARWLGATPQAMERLDQAERLVVRWAELNREDEVGGRWAVERRADGLVVGTVILLPLPEGAGEIEVGWHLHPDAWGQGFATEAGSGALGWGFGHGLGEILAVVRPDNVASLAVCRRIGMQHRGLTDRYYGTELELFALTHADWEAAQTTP